MAEKFITELKVDKKIVEILSKSTYQKSFSSAIRELVSNAYDADSLSVKIKFDAKFSYIEVEDDGNGMVKAEFERYLTIAATKQETQFTRKYKRKRIGQFGVGFLSIFPFCETLEIITTAENSNEILRATIPAKRYFESNSFIKSKKNAEDNPNLISNIPIAGTIDINPAEKLLHYTKIRLVNPTHLVKQYFTKVDTKKTASNLTWDPKDRFIWELQEDLPINLDTISKYYSEYKYDEPIGIAVSVNGKDLFRNDYLNQVLDQGKITISGIECKYIFTTNYTSVKPLEARGIKIRVNNVGIGTRTDFDLRRDRGFSRLHWITGEIFFSEQIKEHLNISRGGFISNVVTDEILEHFAEKLRQIANEIEIIDVAAKELERIDKKRGGDATKPKSEIISSNIKKLENKGYKLVESSETDNKKPIRVDKENKTIYIPKTIKEVERVSVYGGKIEIEYDKWDINEENPACRKTGKNKVSINQNYPLFKSKTYGALFKKLHILLLLCNEDSATSDQLYELLNENLQNEFKEFT